MNSSWRSAALAAHPDFGQTDSRGTPLAGLGGRRFFDYLEIFHDRQRRHTSLGMADAVRVRGSPSANDSGVKPKDPPTVSS